MYKTEILSKLDIPSFYQSFIPSLKVNGKAEALCLCCFHNDINPSLGINNETGLYHCFACGAKGDAISFYQKYKDVDFKKALREIGEMAGIADTDTNPKVMAIHEYRDANGKVLYTKERNEPGKNGRAKEFIFKQKVNGKLITGRGGNPVLYRLSEIVQSKDCSIVEGEAKADLLIPCNLS